MIKKILVFAICLFVATNIAAQTSFNPNFWTGHQIHGSLGFIADEIRHSYPEGYNKIKPKKQEYSVPRIIMRGNATFFYGYEYGYQFAEHWFVGGGLEWTLAYPRYISYSPRNFKIPKTSKKSQEARKKILVAWLQPLTHIRMGYVFDNHVLLSLGLTYLWGLNLNLKMPMNYRCLCDF